MKIGQFIEYKGYIGSIEYNPEDELYYGSLLNIDDFVNYHADNVIDLENQFHNAVDDYIEFCKKVGKYYMEKVYEVEFMNYTNCMRDIVNNGAKEIKDVEYINTGKEPFLIRESEFEKYMKFGDGFRIIKFVGNISK